MNYEFLSYLLKSGLVLAILTAAYAWLVKRETFLQVNRWLLWINVAATLFLPVIPLADLAWMPDAPAKAVAVVLPTKEAINAPTLSEKAQSIPSSQLNSASYAASANAQESSPFSLWDWAAILYIAVAGLLTLKLLIQLGALWHLKRKGIQHETDEGVYLIESKKITSPFSFFHWIFYNPAHHNDEEWAQVWAHECIHAHQRHSIDMLTAEALKIVFWFNPFAWWHQRLVQETLEFITDRAVLDSGIEKKSYQYHLLRTTLSTDKQTFANHFNKSQLKIRIEMMNKKKSKWLGLSKYVVFVGMLWVCAAFTKPYQVKAAAQVVEKLQKLELVTPPKASEKPAFNDFVLEKESENKQKDTIQLVAESAVSAQSNIQEPVSGSKYIMYKGNVLYWIVTPKTTLEDMVVMKKEFAKRNLIFTVNEIKMDPLNQFIVGVAAKGSKNESGGCGFTKTVVDNTFKPLISRGGYITFEGNSCGTTDTGTDGVLPTNLRDIVSSDERTAMEAWNKNQINYLIISTTNSISTGAGGTSTFTKEGLTQLKLQHKKSKYVNLSDSQFLQIAEPRRNDIFMLNGNPSTLEEIEKISVLRVHSAIFQDTWQQDKSQRKQYTLIFTEN